MHTQLRVGWLSLSLFQCSSLSFLSSPPLCATKENPLKVCNAIHVLFNYTISISSYILDNYIFTNTVKHICTIVYSKYMISITSHTPLIYL